MGTSDVIEYHSNTSMSTQPLIILVGPNASGKSSLAVELARLFDGEIISADSRQVYRGLDIGSGKISKKERRHVPHHLLDVASPRSSYTVTHFMRDAKKTINTLFSRGKIPIICGGTGFWIDSLINDYQLVNVPPQPGYRKKLEKKNVHELFAQLKTTDLRRAKTIDPHNKRRLIRALEIIHVSGKKIPKLIEHNSYNVLWIGIKHSQNVLQKRIHTRLQNRMRQGMVKEVEHLHKKGTTWKRLDDLGLEYRYISRFLQGKISRDEMKETLEHEIRRYAKRQQTWFKRNPNIQWISKSRKALAIARKFLSKI